MAYPNFNLGKINRLRIRPSGCHYGGRKIYTGIKVNVEAPCGLLFTDQVDLAGLGYTDSYADMEERSAGVERRTFRGQRWILY